MDGRLPLIWKAAGSTDPASSVPAFLGYFSSLPERHEGLGAGRAPHDPEKRVSGFRRRSCGEKNRERHFMPLYEHVYLARPDVSAQQVEDLTNQFKGVVEG